MPKPNYPIPFKSKLHATVLEELRKRRDLSIRELSSATDRWRESEKNFMAYLPETAEDANRKALRKDGKPQVTTLVVPYSYAMHMTSHTYQSSVFLSRTPVLQFDGTSGAPEQAVQAVDSIMNHQTMIGEHLVPYYTWLLDGGKYGMACLGNQWSREVIHTAEIVEKPATFLGVPVRGKTQKILERRENLKYEGNRLHPVRPYDTHPDPRVAVSNYQRGEFFIIDSDVGWHEIETDDYQNLAVARKAMSNKDFARDPGAVTEEMPAWDSDNFGSFDKKSGNRIHLWECYIRLNPKKWGLDKTWDTPELWQFIVASGGVIIAARPYGALHDKFPYQMLENEPGNYQLTRRSMYDINRPMQEVMDWLINSHLWNVRKTMNDQFLVDPSLVSMKDMMDPLPGKLIRMLPAGYGQGLLKDAVMQLNVADVTQNHFQDLHYIAEMMQRTQGITDNIMGMVDSTGRKTATEVRTSSTFGINRQRTIAEWLSAQAWGPHARMLLSNTQQWMSDERMVRIAGDFWRAQGASRYIQVSPDDIAGEFDFMPVDGTLPIDRFAQANLWREMIGQMAAVPQVAAAYDFGGIFGWVAQLSGLKNIHQFRIDIRPDEEVERDVGAGNVVAMQEVTGGPKATGGAEEAGRVPEPGQLSGMGTTG